MYSVCCMCCTINLINYLKGYAPCRRPPLSGCGLWGVGCAVLAGLLAGLGWAGDARKDELGKLGWPGQAGWVCLYNFSFLFGCCFVLLSFYLFLLFLTLCSSFGSLWGSIFSHFLHILVTIWGTRGFPGQRCAHLLGCSEPQCPKSMIHVVSQSQRCNCRVPILAFFACFQTKSAWIVLARRSCFAALFRGYRDRLTLHPLQPAQSNHSFSCSVSP